MSYLKGQMRRTLGAFAGVLLASSGLQAQGLEKISAANNNRAPWAFKDAAGNVSGFDVDIVRAVFEPVGVKTIEFVISEQATLIPGLIAGRYDIIAAGMFITPERCKQVEFSEPYLNIGDGLIVLAGNPHKIHSFADIKNNPKIRLGAGRGTINGKNAIAAGVSEAQVSYFTDSQAMISAMLAGRLDAAVLSASGAGTLLSQTQAIGVERALPFTGLTREDGTPVLIPSGVVFRKDAVELKATFNKRLAEMKADGSLVAILKKHGFSDDEVPKANITTEQACAGKL